MSAANIALVVRFFEEFINRKDLHVADEVLAPHYQHNNPSLSGHFQVGRESYKELIHGFFRAFPDFCANIEDIFGSGDRVTVRWTWTGTQDGDLNGIPPTGEQVSIPTIGIFQVQDNQIVEGWVVFDTFGLMSQLGVITEDEDEVEEELDIKMVN